jgi:two-component system OmpR family sensor kinase
MSSSPPTDVPVAASAPARWRSPAGWSLRARLVATMIALLALACLVVGATTEIALHQNLYKRIDTQLQDSAGPPPNTTNLPPLNGGNGNPDGGEGNGGNGVFRGGQGKGTLRAMVVDGAVTNSRVRTDYDGTNQSVPTAYLPNLLKVSPGADPVTYHLGEQLGDYRLVARQAPDGDIIITGLPLKDAQSTLLGVAAVIGGITIVVLLVAGFAGAVIVRRTLTPLSRVAATATKVSELTLDRGAVDLAQRVPEADTDLRTEVGQVGAALNRMLDHVSNALEARQASETQVRQFVADASHELRTPLAAIRGYAELSRRSRSPVPDEVAHVLRRVESEAQRMTTLVEDLLLLARLDAGRPLAQDPVDLTMLVVDAVGDAHAAGPRHDWQLDLPDEPVVVTGDGARLHQVLANLLANARTHTPEGTTVTVGVSAQGDRAVLRVADHGPGIPEALLPHIFERFARGDSSRSRAAGSTGLGLSIVHAVVTAHRGTVSVDSSPAGTTFEVRLPTVAGSGGPDAAQQDVAQFVQ